MENIKGNNLHRHENNPLEKQMHDLFKEEFIDDEQDGDENLRGIVFGSHKGSYYELNNRDKSIILSTVQWMGSPIGQAFLEECGFTRNS